MLLGGIYRCAVVTYRGSCIRCCWCGAFDAGKEGICEDEEGGISSGDSGDTWRLFTPWSRLWVLL
jgi:hypothetical protein